MYIKDFVWIFIFNDGNEGIRRYILGQIVLEGSEQVMMLDPSGYLQAHEGDSFEELIKERDELIEDIKELEKIVFDEKKIDDA